jgi:hypothetical protein
MNPVLKIPYFSLKFQKIQKIQKIGHLKKIQKYVLFSCIQLNSKGFSCIFPKNKGAFLSCFKNTKRISYQFMIIH